MRHFMLLTFFSLLLVSCGKNSLTLTGPNATVAKVAVEIADTPVTRERGLMSRTTLADGEGMLFVFKQADILRFWMKNTLIPLDILYFDAKGNLTNAIDHMDPCTSDPCKLYPSIEPSQYALELPAGYRVKHDIGVGWSIDVDAVNAMSTPQ